MPVHFDKEKVEAEIAAMVEKLSADGALEAPGSHGACRRAMVAILPAFVRWQADEMNRGTIVGHQMEAVMVVTKNALVNQLGSIDCPLDLKFGAINEFLQHLAENVGDILANPDPSMKRTVEAEEAGHG
jgi:hypothetical protein